MNDYFLLGQVAEILKVQPYKIVYLLSSRQIPEPAVRLGNRRLFTRDDIRKIAEMLEVDVVEIGGTNEQ